MLTSTLLSAFLLCSAAAKAEELVLPDLPMEDALKQAQDNAKELDKKSETRRALLEQTQGLAQRSGDVNFREDGALEITLSGSVERQADGTGRQLAVSVIGSQEDGATPDFFLAHERTLTYRPDGVKKVSRVIVADRWGNPIEIRESVQAKYKKQALKPALLDQNEFSRELPSILEAFGVASLAELSAKAETDGRKIEGEWPRVLSISSMKEEEGNRTTRLSAVARRLGPGPNAKIEILTIMETRRSSDFAVKGAARKMRLIDARGTVLSSESSLDVNRHHEDGDVPPSTPKPEDAQRLRDIFSQLLPRPA